MNTKQLKIANILIWSGIGLLTLSIILGMPTFYPYLDALIRTATIPMAPPINTTSSQNESASAALLPFDETENTHNYVLAAQESESLTTPTPPVEAELTQASTEVPATVPPMPTATHTPPTPTPSPTPLISTPPKQIQIPSIELDAPVIPTEWEAETGSDGTPQVVWIVPDWKAVGWHYTSAPLGMPGNTVMNGHNTTRGEVFRDLYKTEIGDQILVIGEDDNTYEYRIKDIYILEEAGQPVDVRLENARYIQPTEDERLTLVTCHPYGSTRYRLIVIAKPVDEVENTPTQRKLMNDE